MYSFLLTAAIPLLLSTAQAVPVGDNVDLAERQIKVLAGAPVSDISVKADNLVQCAQSTISWSGAVAPYSLSISTGGLYLPSKQLETHGGLNDASYQWTVTQPEGTGMYFQITDGNGAVGYVQNIFVGRSGDSSCLEGGSSSSSSSAAPQSSSQAQSGSTSSVPAAEPAPVAASSTAGAAGGNVVTITSTSKAAATAQPTTSSAAGAAADDGVVTQTVSASPVAAQSSTSRAAAVAASSSTGSSAVPVTTLTAGAAGSTSTNRAAQAQASSGSGTQTSTAVVSGSVQTSTPPSNAAGRSVGAIGSVMAVVVGAAVVGLSVVMI